MNPLNDLEHFILQPGETLILRPRRPMSAEQIHRIRAVLDEQPFRIVILPDMVDVYAGNIEVIPPAPTADDIEAARTAIIAHYESGKFVQYQIDVPDGEWYDAQKGFLPIGAWHWNKYAYRIKPQ